MTQTLKQKLAVVLAETSNDILESFFESAMTDEYSKWDNEEIKEFRSVLASDLIQFKHQDNYGGEGMGEDYWSVYKFTDGKEQVFVKFEGWYASYNGSEFSEWFFVVPALKTITIYEKS